MKTSIPTKILLPLCVVSLLTGALCRAEAQGTAITYQGRLSDNGQGAAGVYDLTFSVWSSLAGPSQIGSTITNLGVPVTNGLFTVILDFGVGVFTGPDRWLELSAQTNGAGGFATLAPRQQMTPSPYSITAGTISGLVPGASLAGVYSSALTLNNAGNSFSGNGSGLTGLNANNLTTGTVPSPALNNAWKTTGNSGTTPAANFVGTSDNQPLEFRVNNRKAFRIQPNTGAPPSIIGGSNTVNSLTVAAVISGGEQNIIDQDASHAVICGGQSNHIYLAGHYATIAGGVSNVLGIGAVYSFLGAGYQNVISDNSGWSAIVGGYQNLIQPGSSSCIIGGGFANTLVTNTATSVIGGGRNHSLGPQAEASIIGGGAQNTIQQVQYATIGGGWLNSILATNEAATIGGGEFNHIQSGSAHSTIGGGSGNQVSPGVDSGTIAGGNGANVNSSYGTVGGGQSNRIGTNSPYATIPGGDNNIIDDNANITTIGGGLGNWVQTGGSADIIAGGQNNRCEVGANNSVIGGGSNNYIKTNSIYAFIGGGLINTISNNSRSCTIGGGEDNFIGAGAQYATVPGGGGNVATGNFSFAAGLYANALHNGSFVWADSTSNTFASTATDEFSVRAGGGVRLVSDVRVGSNSADYRHVTIGGGNSDGFIYGSYPAYGDGIHFGYNYYANPSGSPVVANPGGATSRISTGYGSVVLATGGVGAAPIDRVTLDSAGNLGIGRSSTANRLEVAGSASKTVAGSWLANSDRRIKTAIATVTNALETLDRVRLVSFHYTPSYRKTHPDIEDHSYLNVVAQEFAEVFPDSVKSSGEKLADGSEILQVDTYPLTIYSAAAIQELNQRLDATRTENDQLRRKTRSLEQRLERLEQLLADKQSP